MTDSQPKQDESPLNQKSGKLGPFRQILVEWEHRRLIYNLVLGAVVVAFVLMLEPRLFQSIVFWAYLLAAAVNACYFAGPVLESYLEWLGVRSKMGWYRPVAFWCGMLFSVCLALLFLVGIGFGLQVNPN